MNAEKPRKPFFHTCWLRLLRLTKEAFVRKVIAGFFIPGIAVVWPASAVEFSGVASHAAACNRPARPFQGAPAGRINLNKGPAGSASDTDRTPDPDRAGFAAALEREGPEPPAKEPPFDYLVRMAAAFYQVEAALIRAVILVESNYNPKAVSPRGASGLMQLMPRTARALGLTDSFDPESNIDAGVRYLRQLLDRFNGDVKMALAAYNAGTRHVLRYGGIPPFDATRSYVEKVLKMRFRIRNDIGAVFPGSSPA